MVMMAAMTAAEIAAAEAAAVAAAEAAAVAAAEAGATQAAQAAAAEAAAAQAAQAATGAEAFAAGNAGAGAELGSGIMQAAPQAAPELASRGITFTPQAAGSSAGTTAGSTPLTPAGTTPPPTPTNAPMLNEYGEAYTLNNSAPAATRGIGAAPAPANPAYSPLQLPPGAPAEAGYGVEGATAFDKFSAFADKHPFMTGAALYTGAYNLGLLGGEQEMPAKRTYGPQLTLSKDFRGSEATPNVYQPSYKTYAAGGVMAVGGASSDILEPRKVNNPMATVSSMMEGGMPGYAKGGALSDSLDFYRQMAEGQSNRAAPEKGDVGIFRDSDPDTTYLDPLSASQVRMAKVNKRANMQMPGMKRPTPMGRINLAPPGGKKQDNDGTTEAAQGGIMQAGSSLGGYAAGGNPRLLKGPGDGMSDNIPAMIGSKQPARLADGEFVIPADVVSHLGNGSTEAGAKRLHEMMTKVRRDRTGNPKQGKQINPRKYMPK